MSYPVARDRRMLNVAAVLILATPMIACAPQDGSTTARHEATLPLGELAGADAVDPAAIVENPLGHDAAAAAEGQRLYVQMNCAGCHGYAAKGAMGPDLTDALWRYGGTPVGIFRSIHEGRPQGMPAWGRSLPAAQIWKITAWLQTLGGALAAQSFHEGRQGDHDVTSVAPGAHDFDGPLTASSAAAH